MFFLSKSEEMLIMTSTVTTPNQVRHYIVLNILSVKQQTEFVIHNTA